MISRLFISSLLLMAANASIAQTGQDTLLPIPADTADVYEDEMDAPMIADPNNYDYMDAVAAPPEAYPVETESNSYYFNRFTFKKLSTPLVSNPDKAAAYPGGIVAMNAEIQNNLRKPYMYGDGAKFVIIEVTVGADSMLYNPKVVYSSGGTYDEYAKAAIEKLPKHFIPAKKNGKSVASVIRIPIRFERMENSAY